MSDSQFNTVVQMIAGLTSQLQSLRQEMVAGLANQEAISQEILQVVGESYEELTAETRKTKKDHGRRLTKLERHIRLA